MPGIKKSRQIHQAAGSPQTGEPVFLVVGKFLHPHGLHGEMLMEVITDFPERIRLNQTLFAGKERAPVVIRSRRWRGTELLLGFEGYDTPEAVGHLRNQFAFVPASDRPALPKGEYYHHQVIGMLAVTDEGQELGFVSGILETGANDVYVVQSSSGAEILLPAIGSVILDIDLEKGRILVHLLAGLLPE
jgi:16S rRNA processing protein RimM